MRIQILFLIKVMRICDHQTTDPPRLHFEPPRLHFEPPGLHCERPRLHFEPLKILNFDFDRDSDLSFLSNVDPDPAFLSNVDPDSAFLSNVDPDPASLFNANPDLFSIYCGSMQIRIRNPAQTVYRLGALCILVTCSTGTIVYNCIRVQYSF
jgi:hypothetical protein